MNLLFEEDGAFRAGTVLSGADASFQVELPSGKRTKVKSTHVLLRFEQPASAQLMERAQRDAEAIELDFLWECSPQQEFGFEELAREYHGRAPDAVESAAILFRLHGAPVYFHRKGRGRFRPAPADILRQALAAVERKRQQDLLRQQYVEQLRSGSLPPAIAAAGVQLAARPDRNSIEFKAVEQAARSLRRTAGIWTVSCFPRSRAAPALPPTCPRRSYRRTCRWPKWRPSRSTTRPPPRSTMRSRCSGSAR
jgi:exoribonuclease-2